MPGLSGLDVTRIVHEKYPSLPIIVMTAFGSIETAVEAIHEGAFDFISKPMNLEELKHTVSKALAQPPLQRRADKGVGESGEPPHPQPSKIIGKTPAMLEVYKTVARVAATKSTVLILGESGTGKEMIARAIHEHSPRAIRPFVAVDCGALTETILESELFGHTRGSFTGAVTDKKGVFEEAQGGTCFLDEIGGITPNLQARLLRVLQEHEVRRVGAKIGCPSTFGWSRRRTTILPRQLRTASSVRILLPVKRRGDPVAAAAESSRRYPFAGDYFLKHYSQENGKARASISDQAMELLCAYQWPGNIRELENAIEQAVALSYQPILTPEDLPLDVREPVAVDCPSEASQDGQFLFADTPSLEEVKKRYVLYVLDRTQGNVSATARILSVDRRSLYRMLARYKIEPFLKDD